MEPPRWGGARFAVALSHDVDIPWRWTRRGVRLGAGRLKAAVRGRDGAVAWREARGLAGAPVHRARGTDPNFTFERIVEIERSRGASSVFFLLAAHRVVQDGPAPDDYDRLRPRVVETLLELRAEIGLHASYTAAFDPSLIAEEKAELERLGVTLHGQRYHYLRVDPHGTSRRSPNSGSRTTRVSDSEVRQASGRASRIPSARGTSNTNVRSTSSRSRWRLWT